MPKKTVFNKETELFNKIIVIYARLLLISITTPGIFSRKTAGNLPVVP